MCCKGQRSCTMSNIYLLYFVYFLPIPSNTNVVARDFFWHDFILSLSLISFHLSPFGLAESAPKHLPHGGTAATVQSLKLIPVHRSFNHIC